MAAQRKSKTSIEVEGKPAKRKTPRSEAAISAIDETVIAKPVPSPARQLQARIRGHYNPMVREFSSRFVTVALTVACLGTWVAGSGLYATL
ncbi:MAG: hypothetical protein AAFZ91_14360 [Pseudomonadota bacterium]